MIYLDNNATTFINKDALKILIEAYRKYCANPSSIHKSGREAYKQLEQARERCAEFINAKYPEEIIFTSSGTEALNLGIIGYVTSIEERQQNKGKHIVSSPIEHPAVKNNLLYLQEKKGYEITYLKVDNSGRVLKDEFISVLRNDTILITIMHANNETGVIQDIKTFARIAKERGITFICDTVQSLGKVNVDVQDLGVDMICASGHKFHGPKGCGFLYLKKGISLSPIIKGGGQERGYRSSTEDLPSILSMVKALEKAVDNISKYTRYIRNLRDHLAQTFYRDYKKEIKINTPLEFSLPNTLNISLKELSAEVVLTQLDRMGIALSSGLACHSGAVNESSVLKAMGLSSLLATNSLRISLSRYNTLSEVNYFLKVFNHIVHQKV